MHCTNCGNQVPNTANVCGHCGVPLGAPNTPPPPPLPARTGLPGWAWGLIGTGAGILILACLGVAGYYFLISQPSQPVPQPAQVVTVVVQPTRIFPTATEVLSQAAPQQIPTSPAQIAVTQYCDTFDGIDMKVVYMDWMPGVPLEFYFKMPGGVPGLEKDIPGASGEWEYFAKIGDYSSSDCDIIQGYKERLYCTIALPKEYSNAMRSLTLNVNKCDSDIYSNKTAFLPGIEKAKGGGGGSSGGAAASCSLSLDSSACSAAGGTYKTAFCTFPPCPTFCLCP